MSIGTTNRGILAAVTTFKAKRRWRLQIMAIALAAATLFASSLASAGAQDGIVNAVEAPIIDRINNCLLYTSPSPRDATLSRMPSSA